MDGPRACRPDELGSLRRLEDTVFRPSEGSLSMFDEFPTLFTPENCERLRVVADSGRIVSAITYVIRPVTIYGKVVRVASLGAVCTYDEYRGRGLATKLLADSFARMRAEKADIVFISGGRGLYLRAGCTPGGWEVTFGLDRAAAERLDAPSDLSVAEATNEDIPALIAIHQREPARYVRSPWDWAQFLSICRLRMPSLPAPWGVRRCWLVRQGGRCVGYIVVGFGRDANAPSAHVVECGGARRSVFAALRLTADRFGLGRIGGSVLPEDVESLGILASAGAETERRMLGGHTLSVLHDQVLDRFRPWLSERVGPEAGEEMRLECVEERWSLVLGDARIDTGGIDGLNSVLFGDAQGRLEGPTEPRATWRQALPLPWVLPGMNYI